MPNIWDMYISGELTGAARESAIAAYLETEPDDLQPYKRLMQGLEPGEHLIDPADLEDMVDLPGEVFDQEDFTLEIDERVSFEADVAKKLRRAANTYELAAMMEAIDLEYRDYPELIRAAEKVRIEVVSMWMNYVDLCAGKALKQIKTFALHSELNRFMAEVKADMVELWRGYGWAKNGLNPFLAALDKAARVQHSEIAKAIEAKAQQRLSAAKTFKPVNLYHPTGGAEMVFTAKRAHYLIRQGYVNRSSQTLVQ